MSDDNEHHRQDNLSARSVVKLLIHMGQLSLIIDRLIGKAIRMDQNEDLAALRASKALIDTIAAEIGTVVAANATLRSELANQENTPEVDAALQDLQTGLGNMQTLLQGFAPPPAPAPAPAPAPPAGS